MSDLLIVAIGIAAFAAITYLFIHFARKNIKENNGQPIGIYGWLLFFVLSLVVMIPTGLVQLWLEFSDYPDLQSIFEEDLSVLALYIAGFVVAVVHIINVSYLLYILVYKKEAQTVKTTITLLWLVAFGLSFIFYIFVASWVYFLVDDYSLFLDKELIKESVTSPLIFVIFWSLYFKRSKRVKNTYKTI